LCKHAISREKAKRLTKERVSREKIAGASEKDRTPDLLMTNVPPWPANRLI